MSLIPGSDSNYQRYKEAVQDLAEDYETRHKRLGEREQANRETAAKQRQQDVLRIQEDADKTVLEAKEHSNELVKDYRREANEEVERLKRQTYNQFGRHNSVENDNLKHMLENQKAAYAARTGDHERAWTENEKAHHQRVEEIQERGREELERATKSYRDASVESYSKAREGTLATDRELRTEAEEKYRELDQQRMREAHQERQQTKQAVEDIRKDYEHRLSDRETHGDTARARANRDAVDFKDEVRQKYADLDHERVEQFDQDRLNLERTIEDQQAGLQKQFRTSTPHQEESLHAQAEAYAREAEEAIFNQNRAHQSETRDLRDQVREAVKIEEQRGKAERNERAEGFAENEHQQRVREKSIQENAERAVDSARRNAEAMEEHLQGNTREALKENDEFWSLRLRDQVKDAHEREQDLRMAFEQEQERHETASKKEAQYFDQRLASHAETMSESKEKALGKQAEAFRESSHRDRAQLGDQIEVLQKHIHKANTTDDITDVSPAAEAAVRKALIAEYEKTLGTETERNQRTVDSMREGYGDKLSSTIEDKDHENEQRQRLSTTEHHRERSDLLNYIQESEEDKLRTLREQEGYSEREKEKLVRSYTQQMEKVKRQYDAMLDSTRDAASAQMRELKQENDFKTRFSHKAFAAKQTELTREYEKRLTNQRADYESLLAETKSQAEHLAREQERKHGKQTEELAKSFEQRSAQSEQQKQERERTLVANYEEQMDRMRRSHDLQSKKKG